MDTFKPLGQVTSRSRSSMTLPTVASKAPSISPLGAERARLLIGGYRKVETDDPKTFVATLAAILSAYPPEVAIAVTDPVSGIVSRSKFPPQAAELREACEAAMEPLRQAERRAADAAVRAAEAEETRIWRENQRSADRERIEKLAAQAVAESRAVKAKLDAEDGARREAAKAKARYFPPDVAADLEMRKAKNDLLGRAHSSDLSKTQEGREAA